MNLYEKYNQMLLNEQISALIRALGKLLGIVPEEAADVLTKNIRNIDNVQPEDVMRLMDDPRTVNVNDETMADVLDLLYSPTPNRPTLPRPGDPPVAPNPGQISGPYSNLPGVGEGPGSPFVDDWVNDILDNDMFPTAPGVRPPVIGNVGPNSAEDLLGIGKPGVFDDADDYFGEITPNDLSPNSWVGPAAGADPSNPYDILNYLNRNR